MRIRLFVSLAVLISVSCFAQQRQPVQQDDSGNSPALRQLSSPSVAQQAHPHEAPESDDPRVRLEWERAIQGVPSPELKHTLHQLRLNRLSGSRTVLPGKNGALSLGGVSGAAAVTSPVWVPIGPTGADYQQNSSFTLHERDSGRARTILPHPTNPDILYFLTSGGGLWMTSNFTAPSPTWIPLTDALTTTGGGAVTFGRVATTLYLGLGDPFDVINVGGSVTKSIDGGATWSVPVDLGAAMSVRDIKVDASGPADIVLAATDVGLFRSTDGGVSFSPVTLGTLTNPSAWSLANTSAGWLVLAQACANVPAVSCGTASQLFLSTDHGATWNAVPGWPVTTGRTTLAVGAPGEGIVYGFAENTASTDQFDLLRSPDGGLTWAALGINAKVAANAAGNTDQPNMDLMHGQSFYNQMILVDPRDATRNTVYLGGNLSSAKTTDGGSTWTLTSNWLAQFGLPYVHADMHAAALSTAGATPLLLFGTDGGIFASADNGASWSSDKNNGLQTFLIYTISATPQFPGSMMIGNQDVGTRVREPNTSIFNQLVGGDGIGTGWSQANSAVSIGSVEFNGVFPNFSGEVPKVGESYDFSSPPLLNDSVFFTAFATPSAAADATGQTFFSYSLEQVFKTTNGGMNWTRIGLAGAGGNVPTTGFRSTAHGISVGPADLLHIAVTGGSGHVEITTNGGSTWADSAIGNTVTGFRFGSSITWADSNTLYVTSENPVAGVPRLAKSIDGGATWTRSDTGLPDVQASRLIVDPRDATKNTLYIATDLGVFESTNAGATWSSFGTGLPNVRVSDLYMPPDGTYLLASTYGRGVWAIPSLSFVTASLNDDVNSCDNDGVLDNAETGHLSITLHNGGSVALSAITATVTSTNPNITFPNGGLVSFPAAAAGADSLASLQVTLNGAVGIQQIDFNIAFNDASLGLASPVNAKASFRGNYDEVPASSSTDDFEAFSSVWTVAGTTGTLPDIVQWSRQTFSSTDHRFVGIDSNIVTDETLVSPPLQVGTGAFSFTFSHRFSFEFFSGNAFTPPAFFDGGVIEVSTDGGASWTDVTAAANGGTITPPYNNLIASGGGNPLTGRQAFTALSTGYPNLQNVAVSFAGTPFANKTILIRFRIGTDAAGGAPGWTIDNVAFTGLSNTPFPSLVAHRALCTAAITTVTSSINPAALGASVAFTATVVGGSSVPTGTVAFNDGATPLATNVALDPTGKAQFSTSALTTGNHNITAVYSGDTLHGGSTSAVLVQTINASNPTTTTLAPPAAVTFGNSFSLTATVSPSTATGTMTFLDGTTAVGTATLANGTASGTFSVLLNAGDHSITASYGGDANFSSSTSAVQTLTVNAAPSHAVVTFITPSPVAFGSPVTISAGVTDALAAGTMTLKDGTTVLATGPVHRGTDLVFGSSTLSVGNHVITGSFSGDPNFQSSTSAAQTFVITQATGAVSLGALSPAAVGTPVTFTSTITPAAGTGTVTFNDGATALGTGTVTAGSASFTTATLAVGSHTITAVYSGDSNVTGATSASQTQIITQAGSTTTLAPTTAAVFGAQVTFTATVTPNTATGNVTFKDGATTLGASPLSGGTASFSTTALAVGNHSIIASYSGDTNFSASSSAAVTQVINPAPTTTTLPTLVAATFGASVTFTATVSPSTATGSVSFKDGAATLGSSPLSVGSASFTTSALNAGTHSITALYSGDASFSTSTSAPQAQLINPAASSVTVTSAPNPSVAGGAVLLTATVTSSAGTPGGTVTFNDAATALGASALNASGVATLTTTAFAAGTHSLTAVYVANGNFASSTSTAVSQVVTPAPDYSVTSDKSSASILAGQSATFTITTQSLNGFKGTINFSCGTLPALATCTFNPASVSVDATTNSATTTFTVKTTGKNASLFPPQLRGTRSYRLSAILWSLGSLGAGIVIVAGFGQKKRRLRTYLLIGLVAIGFAFVGCGGSSTHVTQPPPQTPDGASTIVVTAAGTAAAGSPNPAHATEQLNITITVAQ